MIQLEQVQQDLICKIVEAFRNVPSEQRRAFVIMCSDESNFATVRHAGFPGGNTSAYEGDLNTLGRQGLIDLSAEVGSSVYTFDISPEGFAYYRQLREADGKPIERVESRVTRYLETDQFQQKYARAYRKWKHADTLLWESDSELQLTTIGHLCREAIQEFATSLVNNHQVTEVDENVAHDIARIRAVIELYANQLGEREKECLITLISYWRAVSGLVQRQEHGSNHVSRPLDWEDGRRVVFQTAIVMFEVETSLSKHKGSIGES
jgi:hypothetical protein